MGIRIYTSIIEVPEIIVLKDGYTDAAAATNHSNEANRVRTIRLSLVFFFLSAGSVTAYTFRPPYDPSESVRPSVILFDLIHALIAGQLLHWTTKQVAREKRIREQPATLVHFSSRAADLLLARLLFPYMLSVGRTPGRGCCHRQTVGRKPFMKERSSLFLRVQ